MRSHFILLLATATWAVSTYDVPNPRAPGGCGGWVSDMAAILTPEDRAQLNRMLSTLEVDTGIEIAVVTVPNVAPSPSVKHFAHQLFRTWRIGKQHTNNGVLFLTSVDDRRVEIETGYGIATVLSNSAVRAIIRSSILPFYKRDDHAAGILAGVEALTVALIKSDRKPLIGAMSPEEPNVLSVLFVALPFALLALVLIITSSQTYDYVLPDAASRVAGMDRISIACSTCRNPMTRTIPTLSPAATFAQDVLQSIHVAEWLCPTCNGTHQRTHILNSSMRPCPLCQELTSVQSPSARFTCQRCHWTGWDVDRYMHLMRITTPPSNGDPESYVCDAYVNAGESRWGGGDSGGDGAGDSW